MKFKRNRNQPSCKIALLLSALSALMLNTVEFAHASQDPLFILDPHLLLNPSHRRNALESNGGASISALTSVTNKTSRPQSFGLTTNLALIRDPKNIHSGWGVGLGAYLNTPTDLPKLRTLETTTFELSLGRSTIVPMLKESVGLQGFFEGGVSFTNTDVSQNSLEPVFHDVSKKRRSFFLRFGAMSLNIGQGIVNFKPYSIDQSLITSFVFPSEYGQKVISIAHTAQIACFSAYVYCGTSLSFSNISPSQSLEALSTPSLWFSYGLTASAYFYERKAILRTKLLWDSIKESSGTWLQTYKTPSVNFDLALIF